MRAVCSAACVASCWRARPAVIPGTRISTAKRIIIGEWLEIFGIEEIRRAFDRKLSLRCRFLLIKITAVEFDSRSHNGNGSRGDSEQGGYYYNIYSSIIIVAQQQQRRVVVRHRRLNSAVCIAESTFRGGCI